MFGAIIYILNPTRSSNDPGAENMEVWLGEIHDRIDDIIKQIAK